jgi:hypothetical protein
LREARAGAIITPNIKARPPAAEPAEGQPVASGEQWLGRNADGRRRTWERLNPRHRKALLVLARAFALRQSQARLPEQVQAKLRAIVEEIERLAGRVEKLLAVIRRQS